MLGLFSYVDGVKLQEVIPALPKILYFHIYKPHKFFGQSTCNFCVVCNHSLKTHIEYEIDNEQVDQV